MDICQRVATIAYTLCIDAISNHMISPPDHKTACEFYSNELQYKCIIEKATIDGKFAK